MLIGEQRSGNTSLKRSLKGQLYSSNEQSSDGVIRVVPSHFMVATGSWNTGQEEQGSDSDSADLYYDRGAQKVADHLREDKVEQRTFAQNVGNSSSSNTAEVKGSKSQDDGDDVVQPHLKRPHIKVKEPLGTKNIHPLHMHTYIYFFLNMYADDTHLTYADSNVNVIQFCLKL